MAPFPKKRHIASRKKAGSSHPGGKKGKAVRAGTPKQVGPQIATLTASGTTAKPPKRGGGKTNQSGSFRGSPLTTSNPVNIGERAVGGAKNSPVFPNVYGGGPQITKRPKPPRAKGVSGSGAAGAIS